MSDKVNIEVNNNNLQDIRVDFFPFLSKVQSSQTYTFNFQPDSAKYNAQTVAAGGKIAGIGGPSGTKVFKAISSSPFQQQVGTGDSVAEGDILQVELDATPTTKETVEVVVTYSDIQETKTLPEDLGGNGQFCYFVNVPDGTISSFDVVNETVTTINVAANTDYTAGDFDCCIYYRYTTKELYFHYANNSSGRVAIIDANPQSNSFNTILQNKDFGDARNNKAFIYDQNNDRLLHLRSIGKLLDFSGNELKLINNRRDLPGANHSYLLDRFLYAGDQSSPTRLLQIRENEQSFILGEIISGVDGHGIYNPLNRLVYFSDGSIRIYETSTFQLIASVSALHNTGNLAVDFINNFILYSMPASNVIGVLNGSNNTNFADVRTNTNGHSKPLFSPVTEKFYVTEANSNELLQVDPNVSGLIQKRITIGNQGATDPKQNLADINQIKL